MLKQNYQPQDDLERFFQWYHYDRLGRLDSVWSSRVDNPSLATREAVYTYDDNHGGKVARSVLGNNVETLNYAYSMRDWLKTTTGTQFSQTLKYEDATVSPRFNGNIAQMSWNTAGNAGAYAFTYDNANRLTDAVTTSGPDFSEKLIQYDANGNIRSLTRSSLPTTQYEYDMNKPNRLMSVIGGVNATFTYDYNGNMTSDNTKGTFTYDHRNMPVKIATNDTIVEYAYDAAGQRIKKTVKNGGNVVSRTYYLRGAAGYVIAEYSGFTVDHYNLYGNGHLGKLVPGTPPVITIDSDTITGNQTFTARDSVIVSGQSMIEGEVTLEVVVGVTDRRFYYLTDHLGSVRVVVKDSAGAPVDSWSDYYPFGKIARSSVSSNSPKEKFTGKEHDDESGFDYFGARYYNADIARWISVDPLSGKYPSLTPYNYTANNPIAFIDPNGLDLLFHGDKEAVNSAVGVINKQLEGSGFSVAVGADGKVGFNNTGNMSDLSASQAALRGVLADAMNAKTSSGSGYDVSMKFLQNSELTLSSFDAALVDMTDVVAGFGSSETVTPAAVLGHEIAEQTFGQNPDNVAKFQNPKAADPNEVLYSKSHDYAVKKEEKIGQYKQNRSPDKSGLRFNKDGTIDIYTTVTKNKKTSTRTVTFENGEVKKAEEK